VHNVIVTCPNFDRPWLYKELLHARNGHYLIAVLQVVSDSTDLAQFLPLIYQVTIASSV